MSKILALVFSLSFAMSAFAEDAHHAEPAKEEGHGGGGEHGGSGDGHGSPEQKSSKELMELEKQISTTAAKITAKNSSVTELIKQKQHETNPEKLAETIKLLQQEHRELNALIKEHSTQVGILQYRYPERGISLQRKYKRFNAKSLEEMEKSLGLEGHLKRSRDKINRVYGVDTSKPKTNVKTTTETKTDKESILGPTTISK